MSIKILGGVARGFPLATPKTETRPTSVMIKRKLFDWRQNLEGYVFIDVCAGSGAMAFEALSRGADQVLINDQGKPQFQVIKKNKEEMIRAFKFDEKKIIISSFDAKKWVARELGFHLSDDADAILYLDPPYEDHALYREILATLKEKGFQGEVWVESDRQTGIKLDELTGLFHSVIKTVEQGDHFVLVGKLI